MEIYEIQASEDIPYGDLYSHSLFSTLEKACNELIQMYENEKKEDEFSSRVHFSLKKEKLEMEFNDGYWTYTIKKREVK